MASLKGGETLYNNVSVSASSNQKSALAYVGPGPYVSLFITNLGANSLTFKVQASGTAKAQAGRNALDSTADGGLTWFDYTGPGGDGAETAIVVAGGAAVAIDLAPFSPEFIRIFCTVGGSASNVTAFVTSFGPN